MFKKIPVLFLLCFVFLMLVTSVFAQPPMKTHSLVFKWDRNPDVDSRQVKTTGYNIYYSHDPDALLPENFDYGKETSNRINQEDIPQPESGDTVTYTYTDVPAGDYYFVCTAHNEHGTESPPSNMVHQYVDYTAPGSPNNFKISISITINQE